MTLLLQQLWCVANNVMALKVLLVLKTDGPCAELEVQVTNHHRDLAAAAAVDLVGRLGGRRSEASDSIGRLGEALVC